MTRLAALLTFALVSIALWTGSRRIARGGLVRVVRILAQLLDEHLDLFGQRDHASLQLRNLCLLLRDFRVCGF